MTANFYVEVGSKKHPDNNWEFVNSWLFETEGLASSGMEVPGGTFRTM